MGGFNCASKKNSSIFISLSVCCTLIMPQDIYTLITIYIHQRGSIS